MKNILIITCFFLIGLISEPQAGKVNVITISSAINPIVAEFIVNSIKEAEEDDASALVIKLDTPGGLDTAMRDIIKAIEESRVPVITYVSPSGARAASAGCLITLASHVAAMAPATNIGAAHPVSLGGDKIDEEMKKKVENDAVAYIKGIAKKHGRNEKWAEKAVRESVSITSEEAKELNVVDLIAPDLVSLLDTINGRKVIIRGEEKILQTKSAEIVHKEMGWRHRFLNALSNPELAYILFMLGFWGILFELYSPGAIFPGVLGGICLILAFMAFQTLPINYAGVLLIILGIILFVVELKVVSYGLLTIGGLISLVLGSIILFESSQPFYRISYSLIGGIVLATALFFIFATTLVVKAQMKKPVTGTEGMIGMKGKASTRIEHEGKVFVNGEYWNATSDEVIEEGAQIIVTEVDGLKLKVSKFKI
jgi:membrane-bound serine protease (ClpP class)